MRKVDVQGLIALGPAHAKMVLIGQKSMSANQDDARMEETMIGQSLKNPEMRATDLLWPHFFCVKLPGQRQKEK